ncbi:MAG: glycosyltransferase family A protein, partial [Candidatus Aenigmarchaeota archaeon]|nr:glycosyltransferase family A protein [Candidatus Aenigmarchaeota archaeon]MDI6722121.1 glycosyltransferase family A protein [Candidatus Aenigmarchaeota archaeon]
MKPLVSICIPNYNSERFIKQTIKSALSQSYPNIEVIVCDNASTDNSCNIIKSFGKKIRRYRNKINIGQNDNLNKCISLSKGKY